MKLVGLLLGLSCLPGMVLAAQCSVGETVGAMKKVEIDGVGWFAIDRGQLAEFAGLRKQSGQLKQLTRQLKDNLTSCLDLVTDTDDERHQYQGLAQKYAALTKRYDELKRQYQSLDRQYQAALQQSVDLATDFETKSDELVGLTYKYDDHVSEWRKHAEECRDIATNANSGITFDLGVGMTEGDSRAAGLVGVGVGRLKAWGFLQNRNSGFLLGTTLDF